MHEPNREVIKLGLLRRLAGGGAQVELMAPAVELHPTAAPVEERLAALRARLSTTDAKASEYEVRPVSAFDSWHDWNN